MGAAKIPEQIDDRREIGRQGMLDDRARDPLIERLKALPVNRNVKPKKKSRKKISDFIEKNDKDVAKN